MIVSLLFLAVWTIHSTIGIQVGAKAKDEPVAKSSVIEINPNDHPDRAKRNPSASEEHDMMGSSDSSVVEQIHNHKPTTQQHHPVIRSVSDFLNAPDDRMMQCSEAVSLDASRSSAPLLIKSTIKYKSGSKCAETEYRGKVISPSFRTFAKKPLPPTLFCSSWNLH